ncbi:TRAP-type C4-dicarboxylate transport system, substrate-binding protein [Lutimaribacter pacificus]|uniref:TRAP-type C4-dicarboxylate transport system, substrate-binding protein n=1 Tax=Lutimaribacter pacificus TaxID=391948 RepID=A0A1H0ENS3_9RHOB|nr:TRAP transporter substrate-binding protein DctP [Lutimaribacter pacificus]SDN83953.1 TRAP-type C4-dicarboxylate transport system, substrate-binding protein [Lutimaribacter pacificus]SHK50831.1 TRAP-type C4-dicarboxylate transport system, substrate-binding protein [Lutimaribacter pacificus]
MNRLNATALVACLVGSPAVADMQYSLPFNGTNEFSKIGIEWAEAVSEATGGEVSFEPVLNSALVSIPETLDAVTGSVVPAAMGVASAMAGTIPAFGYLELNLSVPIDNPPTEEAMAQIFPDVDKLLEPHGVKALWIMPAFGGGLACRDEFLETVDEWSGKKFRTAGRWQAKQMEAAGASPVALPAADIYTALQNGTIDCAVISASIYLASSLYEVAPYFSDYSFAGNSLITMVGADIWDDLSDEQKQIVQDLSDEMTVKGTRTLREISAQEMEQVKQQANYHKASDAEMAVLLDRWDPVYQEAMAGVSDEVGKHLVETLYSFGR